MDVYRQAAKIVQQVRSRVATAKALCLESQMQKKKQTYAVVCETLRHYNLLKDVLETAEWSKFYPDVDEHLAMVLVYDAVVGRGVNTRQDPAAWAVHDNQELLVRAYEHVKGKHVIPPSLKEKTGTFPRYGRVNTLKGKTLEDVMRLFRKRNRIREEGEEAPASTWPLLEMPTLTTRLPEFSRTAPSASAILISRTSCSSLLARTFTPTLW